MIEFKSLHIRRNQMRYEYECTNKKCMKSNKPYEFEVDVPLKDYKKIPKCPKCKSTKNVAKVYRTAFPKSQSWMAS